jgi:hypothetical protein
VVLLVRERRITVKIIENIIFLVDVGGDYPSLSPGIYRYKDVPNLYGAKAARNSAASLTKSESVERSGVTFFRYVGSL